MNKTIKYNTKVELYSAMVKKVLRIGFRKGVLPSVIATDLLAYQAMGAYVMGCSDRKINKIISDAMETV